MQEAESRGEQQFAHNRALSKKLTNGNIMCWQISSPVLCLCQRRRSLPCSACPSIACRSPSERASVRWSMYVRLSSLNWLAVCRKSVLTSLSGFSNQVSMWVASRRKTTHRLACELVGWLSAHGMRLQALDTTFYMTLCKCVYIMCPCAGDHLVERYAQTAREGG